MNSRKSSNSCQNLAELTYQIWGITAAFHRRPQSMPIQPNIAPKNAPCTAPDECLLHLLESMCSVISD